MDNQEIKKIMKKYKDVFEALENYDKIDKNFHEWGQGVEPYILIVKHFSKPGDTVLDPFMGGGPVIEACLKTDRNPIGYEIDKKYFDMVNGRLLT